MIISEWDEKTKSFKTTHTQQIPLKKGELRKLNKEDIILLKKFKQKLCQQ
jgi:hypothetical protein